MMAMGNHEAEAGWYLNNTPNNLAIWGTLERKNGSLILIQMASSAGTHPNNPGLVKGKVITHGIGAML